jgi:hypothetical protein
MLRSASCLNEFRDYVWNNACGGVVFHLRLMARLREGKSARFTLRRYAEVARFALEIPTFLARRMQRRDRSILLENSQGPDEKTNTVKTGEENSCRREAKVRSGGGKAQRHGDVRRILE